MLRLAGTVYVSVFCGTPALIQLFILYFGGPQIGINLDAFEAGIIGLGRFQTMRKVILPQAARLMIRPLGVNINAQIKATALVSAISVVELTYTAQRYIGSTYKPFEMFFLAGVIYMVIIYVTGLGINWLDRKAVIK